MIEFITRTYDGRVHRVAFPQRAAETRTLVDPGEEGELNALIGITDAIQRHRSGEMRLVPPEDDYVGNYREYVLAPFAYKSESRLSNGAFGVLYNAEDRATAIQEVAQRLARYYADGNAPPQETRNDYLTLRVVADDLADIRATVVPGIDRRIYDPDDYTISQRIGASLRDRHPGLTYDSVRRAGGVCLGAFVPWICHDVRLMGAIDIVWNGERFSQAKHVEDI